MPQLIWSPAALRDIERLHRFLAEKNPEAARRAAKAIREGMNILRGQPGGADRRCGHGCVIAGKNGDKARVGQPCGAVADDRRALFGRNAPGQICDTVKAAGDLWAICAFGQRAEQIKQLPELDARRTIAADPCAQHGGKAIIEIHWRLLLRR